MANGKAVAGSATGKRDGSSSDERAYKPASEIIFIRKTPTFARLRRRHVYGGGICGA